MTLFFPVPSIHEINKNAGSNGLNVISLFAGCGGSSTGYKMAGCSVKVALEFVDKAAETYRANAPSTHVIEGDIRGVSYEDLLNASGLDVGELDILDGSPPCFTAGTIIMTDSGFKAIEDVLVGDFVLTHKLRWRKVTSAMGRKAATVVVKGQGHHGIVTTAEHPFWARRLVRTVGKVHKRDWLDPEWVEAKDLKPSKSRFHMEPGSISWFWSAPTDIPVLPVPAIMSLNSRSHKFSMNESFMWVVGAWLGDGWLRTGKTHNGESSRGEVYICCNRRDTEFLREKLEEAGVQFYVSDERTTSRFGIACKSLANWLESEFGRYSGGKRFPAWVYGMPKSMREALLDGYLYADGYITTQRKGSGRVRKITTINKSLAIGTRMLANSLGFSASIIRSNVDRDAKIEGRSVSECGFYTVAIYDTSRSAFQDQGMFWGKVRSVEETGKIEEVFNIEVDEDNSYVADGIVVHNCQTFSSAGLREKAWGKEVHYSGSYSQRSDDLFFEFTRMIEGVKPKVFVAENVTGLVDGVAKGYFKEIYEEFVRLGYRVEARKVQAVRLGVPQRRERIIFVGVRNDLGMDPVFPTPLHGIVTAGMAFRGLASPEKGEFEPLREGTRTRMAWEHTDVLTDPNGCFKYAYGRLGWGEGNRFMWFKVPPNRPIPTITGKVPCLTHWSEPRTLSIAEAKRAQSFPDDFVLPGKFKDRWERIGRSVPPLMMKHIAETISREIFKR